MAETLGLEELKEVLDREGAEGARLRLVVNGWIMEYLILGAVFIGLLNRNTLVESERSKHSLILIPKDFQ